MNGLPSSKTIFEPTAMLFSWRAKQNELCWRSEILLFEVQYSPQLYTKRKLNLNDQNKSFKKQVSFIKFVP